MTEEFPELPPALFDGYRRFRKRHYQRHLATYEALAGGQNPQVMIIACCDSRVDPTTVFDAPPGELFVVRNVANLVPPYEPQGDYHGTSAALEFAVTGLQVRHIVVMGHAQCGGIAAYVDGLYGDGPGEEGQSPSFIAKWMSIVHGARSRLPASALRQDGDLKVAMERASILNSIDNLLSFPFIREAITSGQLQLHGTRFGIADGVLEIIDPASGEVRRPEPVSGEG